MFVWIFFLINSSDKKVSSIKNPFKFCWTQNVHKIESKLNLKPENECRETIELKLEDIHSSIRAGIIATDQIFTHQKIFVESWEYAEEVCICFIEMKETCERVPRKKLWRVLRVNGVDDHLSLAVTCPRHCIPVQTLVSVSMLLNHNQCWHFSCSAARSSRFFSPLAGNFSI